ncbi:MAG: cardiolipin synthase B [Acidimicrobiia bacterium]|nr:cardiolipin synthase B [Acidimicrobiia bacterium]
MVIWTIAGIAFLTWFVLVVLFTPRIDYHVSTPLRPDSEEFLHVVQLTCQAPVFGGNQVKVFANGAQFYPAMRDAIRAATASVNLEAYIFRPGEVADMMIEAMVERARAGVQVRLVVDAIGSSTFGGERLRRLRDAGCDVQFYQRLTWHRLHRANNRTHRELLVVDGRIAFTGGAGVADVWFKPVDGEPSWRDTMARIEGPIVSALQGVFAENWLECGGEILTSPRDWPPPAPAGRAEAMLVKSSPSDRATSSRVVFQMLIEGAVREIDISTPYFLPDRALRRALVRAAQRGVRMRVLVPGPLTDERLVRLASRRMYGELIDGGVRIWEYRPAMTHVKALIVDDVWAVIGTTNLDNRSFEHNDEVNVAFREAAVTARLRRDFESDLAASDEITARAWAARSPFEKLVGPVCWILERQQ